MGWSERVRRALLPAARGAALAAVSILAGVPVLVASVVSIGLVPVGIGLLAVPATVGLTRGLAGLARRWALEWSGLPIDTPYQWYRRPLGDPATWRDLLWLLANAPVGLVLGLLPVCLLLNGVFGVLVAPLVWALSGSHSLYWPLSVPIGVAALALFVATGARILRAHAVFSASLLAPSRVNRLRSSRAEVVDTAAAELRRIERDLHDGAQARLAALGMNIGLAEQLVRSDPDMAVALLVEARESSGRALSELRDLVRGIHPPVLAERGLDGAVRALALTVPLPVDVDAAGLDAALPAPVEAAAYFAIAEALANVIKHSGATRAWIRLRTGDGRLTATVGDDGAGGVGSVGAGGGVGGVGAGGGLRRDPPPVGRVRRHDRYRQPARRADSGDHGVAVRIVIGEDLALLRDGLVRLLTAYQMEVVEAVDSGPALLRALVTRRPDVAVVDVRLPPTFTDEGLRAAIQARAQVAGLPIVVLSQHVEVLYARELLADGRGGVGYLLKDRVADVTRFVDTVRVVAAGGTVLDPDVVARLLARQRPGGPLSALTPREREVLALMAEGRANAAIAARLVVTEKAVSKHINNIFSKLGLHPDHDDHRRVLAVLAYLNG